MYCRGNGHAILLQRQLFLAAMCVRPYTVDSIQIVLSFGPCRGTADGWEMEAEDSPFVRGFLVILASCADEDSEGGAEADYHSCVY